MSMISTQYIALLIKDNIANDAFCRLEDVAFTVLRDKLLSYSDERIYEVVEDNIQYIAEILRNDASEARQDGTPLAFEIDDEQTPYIRAFPFNGALLSKLRRIDPFAVEDLCAQILFQLGATANSTKKTGDGGVDFIATNLNIMPAGYGVPSVCRATVIGQTKRYKENNIIVERQLREFVGSGVWKRHKLRLDSGISPLAPVILAFWTTSSFEPSAKRYAREMGIWYMDGKTLVSYIEKLDLANYVFSLQDECILRNR